MGFDPSDIVIQSGDFPPLYDALCDRDFSTAAKLIKDGAKLDSLIEDDGHTLLHDAAHDGDLEMVEFFLDQECLATLEQFDYIAQTPLIRAADNGQTEIVVRLLSARVNPNAHDENRIGNTAIREAVRGGHIEIVLLLLRAGADPTIPGWIAISAVDQAWVEVDGTPDTTLEIQTLLSAYPSKVREKQNRHP